MIIGNEDLNYPERGRASLAPGPPRPPEPGPANPAPAGGLAVAVGMPGWQIALIAAGAALAAAVLAVLLYRTWAMRRTTVSA